MNVNRRKIRLPKKPKLPVPQNDDTMRGGVVTRSRLQWEIWSEENEELLDKLEGNNFDDALANPRL
jgi:hypothetical protein